MLSLEDCLALCELSEDEVLAIAHHEHLPEIAAAELGNYLVPHARKARCGSRRSSATTSPRRAPAATGCASSRSSCMLRNFVLQHPRCEERHSRQLYNVERRNGRAWS